MCNFSITAKMHHKCAYFQLAKEWKHHTAMVNWLESSFMWRRLMGRKQAARKEGAETEQEAKGSVCRAC